MFPEKQKRGFRVHRNKENEILDALQKGRALPGLFASQTPKGVQILGGGASAPASSPIAATGLLASDDLQAVFEQQATGSVNGSWVAVAHADQLELFATTNGTENRWLIINSGGTIWYKSQTADVFSTFDKVGSPSPSQGTAPATLSLVNFPSALNYDNGTDYTIHWNYSNASSCRYSDFGATVALEFNTGSDDWEEQGGAVGVSTSFVSPIGTGGGVTVSYLV